MMRYLAVEMGVRMVRDISTVPIDVDSFYLFECSKRTTDFMTAIVHHRIPLLPIKEPLCLRVIQPPLKVPRMIFYQIFLLLLVGGRLKKFSSRPD